jgi:hypothetical protein
VVRPNAQARTTSRFGGLWSFRYAAIMWLPTGADIVEKDDRPFDFDSDTIDGLEMARVSRATFVRFFLSLGEDKGRDSAEVAAALDLDGLR